jgi:hypothetical protein
MAENPWQGLHERNQWDIRRAFQELRRRWSGIWDQEGLRWNAAVNQYRYAMNSQGQWFHEWVSKPAAERIEGMKQAIEGMREANDTRLPWEAYSGYGSWMNGPSPERRMEPGLATELAQSSRQMLERRLAEVEAFQARYPVSDYRYWNAGEEAKQIRAAINDPAHREAYVKWVVEGAIETGIEEGYPLRDPQALANQLRREEGLPSRVSQTESKLEGVSLQEVESLRERFDAVAPQLTPAARDTIPDRLAALLEDAQRRGLLVAGEPSQTEDLKQRQKY